MNSHTCQMCDRHTTADRALCRTCLTELDKTLGKIVWLDEQLEVTQTRQRSVPLESGPRATGHALPWHETASDTRRSLDAVLTRWAEAAAGHFRSEITANTIAGKVALIQAQLHRLTADPDQALDVHDAITTAVTEAERVVFWTPRTRVYLGPCERPVLDDEGLILIAKCDGDLYADEGAAEGTCRDCGATVEVTQTQLDLNARLDEHLMTPAEIARAAVYLGLRAPREVVRERVNRWHRHHLIEQRGTDDKGHPLFRYGDVRRRLLDDLERQQTGTKAAGA